jgi:MFS family permease
MLRLGRTFTCISIVPMASRIAADLASNADKPQTSASVLLVTIWELGEAVGPLVLAPLSEARGRLPVVNCANMLFVAATILAGLSNSTALFLSARALSGLAVATNLLSPAIIGDMFAHEERGAAMSVIMLSPLIGGATGPAVGGALAQRFGWRAVVFVSAGLAGLCEVMFLIFFRETYKPVIVARKNATAVKDAGETALTPHLPEADSTWAPMWEAVMRPAAVLSGSRVLQMMALFGSFIFAYFYILAVSLPDILQNVYGLSEALTGTAFLCFSLGSSISVLLCNKFVDRIYVGLKTRKDGVGRPEFRLPLVVVSAALMPLAIALYGWTAALHWPLALLLGSVGLVGSSMLIGWIPLLAYVVDAFGDYSASALTGMIVVRCLMGTFLPLLTPVLSESIGYGWGFLVFAGTCVLLAPIPVLILRYGERWRQRSIYSRDS